MHEGLLSPILGNNTKSTIIDILSQNPPFTLKQLHAEVEKQSNKPITYQATHKAVTEMITDGILKKIGKEISINKEWTEKISLFTAKLKAKEESPTIPKTKNVTVLELDNFVDFGKYIIKFSHDTPNPQNKPGVCIMRHAWPSFGMDKTSYELLAKMLKETKYYDLVYFDTPLDRAFAKMLKEIGKNTKTGVNYKVPYDAVCKGSDTVYIYFSEDFIKKYDEMFDQIKTVDESIKQLMEQFMTTKTKITLIHIKDEELTQKIIKEAIKAHDEKK